MTEKLLPLDTIVYLKEGTAKLMIVGRGASFEDEEELRFLEVYEEWKKDLGKSTKKEKQTNETFGF
ncbi:hypothetical protein UL360_002663 [Enterococcus faecium]|nr:hypothetical protein [Enterococcus faecium]EGP5496416.1 hypothetical protein [Enterococcus faecium]EME3504230.1 hypothetical protein [Enterococcus faecium]EMF0346848.1 hypothetical protein [Enterococcus faecium]